MGHIPYYFQVPWSEAGLMQDVSTITPVAVFVIEGTPTDDDTEWATALSNARSHVTSTHGLAVIYFLSGTYYFDVPFTLNSNDSNIVIQGAGSRITLFHNLLYEKKASGLREFTNNAD